MSQYHIRRSLFISLPGLPTSPSPSYLTSLSFSAFLLSASKCQSAPILNSENTALHIFPGVGVQSLSCVRLFAIPWTVAYHAPPSTGFSRQEYWTGLPFPSPEALPDPGIEPGSPALQVHALPSEPLGKSQGRAWWVVNVQQKLFETKL